jgi:transposase-like protein
MAQEILPHVDALLCPPTLQRRTLSSLHPHPAVKRAPTPGPRCPNHEVDPWGQYHDRPGGKRYRCHGGKRPFNDLTATLLHQSTRPLAYWILAAFLVGLACAARHIAQEVRVPSRTSYRWGGWLRHAAVSYEMQRQVDGTVAADALYHTAGHKGQAPHGGKKPLRRRARGRRKQREPGRGHYDKEPARDYRLSQSPGGWRPPGDPRCHGVDGADGRGPRRPHRQSALHGLREQLSGGAGLPPCVRPSYPEGIRARGGA